MCVAGVQEGSWPDLRRRGSLLGSECARRRPRRPGRGRLSTIAAQLAEERRLFYVAVTRARRELLVTAVSGDEEQPSRFLDELDPVAADRAARPRSRSRHAPRRPGRRTARGRLRPAAPGGRREAAAARAGTLAAAGVRGADPAEWWGLADLSDDGPVADPDRLRFRSARRASSPSCGASCGRCSSSSAPARVIRSAETLGTLIHEVAAAAPDDADLAELEALLDARWSRLDFGARWLAEHQRLRARTMLAKLVAWLRDTRADLSMIAVERDFDVVVGDARLRGRVDRLERDRAGRPVVVDLKTGKSKPTAEELAVHPQLGAYQLAV